MDLSKATFWGYRRENGRVGVRNHVIILPVDDLSNAAAQAVENNIKGTMALPTRTGGFNSGRTSSFTSVRSSGPGPTPTLRRWW
jgi:(2R)-sulfolactate sulfo-lyase subunit beta